MLLTQVLDDPYAVVRAVADRSLRTLLEVKRLDYDFVAPAEQRQRSQSALLDQARQRLANKRGSGETARSADQWRQLLLTPNGQLLRDELQTLTRDRDDRDLELPE